MSASHTRYWQFRRATSRFRPKRPPARNARTGQNATGSGIFRMRRNRLCFPSCRRPLTSTRCARPGGRFGAHNIHQNRPDATAAHLTKTVVGSFFNGGVRAYSIAAPHAPVEIGYLVDAAPPGHPSHTIQINDVYVDEHGLIYANDRFTGGLDIIRYTGSVALE